MWEIALPPRIDAPDSVNVTPSGLGNIASAATLATQLVLKATLVFRPSGILFGVILSGGIMSATRHLAAVYNSRIAGYCYHPGDITRAPTHVVYCWPNSLERRSIKVSITRSSNWNSLPAHLRDNSLSLSSFRRHLKTFLFSFY